MASITGSIAEAPGPELPADLANRIALIGFYPGLNSATPQIVPVTRFNSVRLAAGGKSSKGAECAAFALRAAEARSQGATIYLVPHPATVPGVVSFVGQTGFGPPATLAPLVSGETYDDADVFVRVREGGAPGVATYELATTWDTRRDADGGTPSITPRYEVAKVMPPRAAATITGNVDLTTLTYAQPAKAAGTVDIVNSTTLYGPAGTLAGTKFDVKGDAGSTVSATFGTGVNAPMSYLDVLDKFESALGTFGSAEVDGEGHIVVLGEALSTAGSLVLTTGSPDALAPLGLSAGTTAGTAGVLDGKTVIIDGDATSGEQTVQFSTGGGAPANADDVVAELATQTGVDASLYSGKNYLRVGSSTLGSTSTFAISGGTARVLLGLPATTAVGAESEVMIDHLGCKLTFPAGTYPAGYVRQWKVRAPAPSADDIIACVDALKAQEVRFGRIWVAADVGLSGIPGTIQALDSRIAALETANDPRPCHGGVMAPLDEPDDLVYQALTSNPTRRVDAAARTLYARPASLPVNAGSVIRSQGWAAVAVDAAYPLGSDRGQHQVGGTPSPLGYIDYIPVDEDDAQVRMAPRRSDAALPRINVIQRFGNGPHFCGGFTLALPTSDYTNQHVRDRVLRIFGLVHAGLKTWLNKPELPLTVQGRLTEEGASAIVATLFSVCSDLLPNPNAKPDDPPALVLALSFSVSTVENVAQTERLKATVRARFPGIARDIEFTVGPGLIAEG